MVRTKFRLIFISGLLFVLASLVGAGLISLGLIPVNADATPSFLERKLLPMIVRASVSRQASRQSATSGLDGASTSGKAQSQSIDTAVKASAGVAAGEAASGAATGGVAARGDAAGGDAPVDDSPNGDEIYREMCAQCHGRVGGRASILGASFYPPAPQLPGRGSAYTESEMFWLVKHGIRNTSMPAWRNLLSDDDIRKVVRFVESMDHAQ